MISLLLVFAFVFALAFVGSLYLLVLIAEDALRMTGTNKGPVLEMNTDPQPNTQSKELTPNQFL